MTNQEPDVQGFDVTPHEQPQMQQPPAPQQMQQPQTQQETPNAFQAIIEQQQAQIAALIEQTNAQSAQITQMVQNGAQFSQPAHQVTPPAQSVTQPVNQFPNYYEPSPMQTFNPPALGDNQDYSLESLAEQIGKKD